MVRQLYVLRGELESLKVITVSPDESAIEKERRSVSGSRKRDRYLR